MLCVKQRVGRGAFTVVARHAHDHNIFAVQTQDQSTGSALNPSAGLHKPSLKLVTHKDHDRGRPAEECYGMH